MNNNRRVGNAFEQELCDILYDHGFWAHNLAQNSAGQPFDVIAARGRTPVAIDCKVCERDRFVFTRIEQNQDLAMQLWKDCGNGEGWFALKMADGTIWFLGREALVNFIAAGKQSLNRAEVEYWGYSLEDWVVECV